ncbi:hypothetical protein FE257_002902 [Aspergillus nanangensis]|uniref:Uncharacterized protein n=1 Tax=Aspergillus nanangensis TaxID=2582783 RepID=A0AAD4CSK1_ASPNN|nr:hypothetical protein FE257_002902 [Aspergillus nanangensis]
MDDPRQEKFPLELPGFNLPLNHKPPQHGILFPNALDYADLDSGAACRINIFREIVMMRVMNTITDKPEWDRKVFDKEIVAKWTDEISALKADITPKMIDWVVEELKWKAGVLHDKNHVLVFDTGVVKSDSAVTPEEQRALQEAIAPLDQVSEDQKDYHPGSDRKVVDLVHPSLFPVVYGRTRILPDQRIGLDDCMSYIGQGEILKVPSEAEAHSNLEEHTNGFIRDPGDRGVLRPYSRSFQWLPCDVEFTGDDNGCRIVSYINNLHPVHHRPLYAAIESVLNHAVRLWDETLALTQDNCPGRLSFHRVDYLPHPDPEPEPGSDQDEDSDSFLDLQAAWEDSCPILLPEPGNFDPQKVAPRAGEGLNLRKEFRERGIQVIVKLANIELTPENPNYTGGSWHVEGQLNERICATALYYYDSKNITESKLSFRQNALRHEVAEVRYAQDRHGFLQSVYGFGPDIEGQSETNVTQHLGSVVCREGRLLTFPNILQHRVTPFGLANRSKPGHRKILALFLVDPHQRHISTANVPPQQEAWAREKRELVENLLMTRLPVEIQDMVKKDAAGDSISWDEATQYRLDLMEERSGKTDEQNAMFETGQFNLCEH